MTEGDDYKAASRLIAINPTLKAELIRAAPALTQFVRPATDEEIVAKLVSQAPHFGIMDRGEEFWGLLFSPYLDALSGMPMEALDEAFLRWNRAELYPDAPGRHAFMPKAAELYKLAEPKMLQLRGAGYRAKRALEHVEALPKHIDRDANRKAAIAAGLIDEDGKVIWPKVKRVDQPLRRHLGESPQELAQRIRRAAEAAPAETFEDPI